MSLDADRAPRLSAVLGERFGVGDLAFAFDAGGVARRKRRDQPLDPVADLEREMGCDRAGQGANVLRGDLARPLQQSWVLRLAHPPPPIFASSARLSISACCPSSIASWSPITQTWL